MDFITSREFRTQPGKVWEKLATEQELVVTRNGKPFAILVGTTPTDLEQDLKKLSRLRFGRALDNIRARAKETGLDKLTLEEINGIIREAREARRNAGGC